MFEKRIEKLRDILNEKQLDAAIIASRDNTMYLSGFSGSNSIIVITKNKCLFGTDFRYMEAAAKLSESGYEVVKIDEGVKSMASFVKDMFSGSETRIGFENTLSYGYFNQLKEQLGDYTYVDIYDSLLDIRSIKDENELELLQKAAQIGDIAFSHILKVIKPGMTELDTAAELEYVMKKNGASFPSFDTIAIFGEKTSMPHGVCGNVKLMRNDIVTLDFGANFNGYCSDMTRTFFIGTPKDELKKIYEIVFNAQSAAQEAVKEGMTGSAVDKVARDIISDQGYGECFGHSTGHGVGLLVHEQPRLSTKSNTVLKKNMVVTIEPGIYIPGLGGVRIENTVIVQQGGCVSLNHSDKNMIVL